MANYNNTYYPDRRAIAEKILLAMAAISLSLVVCLCNGCQSYQTAKPLPPPLTMQQTLDYYNANVYAIPQLQVSVSEWRAQFFDKKGEQHKLHERGGGLIFRPSNSPDVPADFNFWVDAPLKRALVAGSNAEEFWSYSQWAGSGYWGKYEHKGKPCADHILIYPQLILDFIGLTPIPQGPPYPLYKVYPAANIIEYVTTENDASVVSREIIIDRYSNLPKEINSYSAAGGCIMHSELKNYKPLGQAMLPADILLSWPGEDSFIHLKLNRFKTDTKNRDKLFTRPPRIADIDDYQQIDKDCEK